MGDSEGFVPNEILDRVPWRGYVAARYGFRNHWYPALLSDDIAEEEVRAGAAARRAHPAEADPTVASYGIRDQLPAPRRAAVAQDRVLHQGHDHLLVSRLHLPRSKTGMLCDIVGAPQSRA